MKNLQLKFTTITLLFIVFSCTSIKKLPNNKYVYKSKKRTLELYFRDSSTCVLKNTFKCSDINPNFKNIITECNYLRKGDTIFLNRKNTSNTESLYLFIPPQKSKKCDFLNKEKRERVFSIGPSYATDYEKYGLVPNINQDTLYIINNRIFFYKQVKRQGIGFMFK